MRLRKKRIKWIGLLLILLTIEIPEASAQNARLNSTLLNAHDLVHSDPDSALVLYNLILTESKDSLMITKALNGSANAFQFKSQNDTAIALYFTALGITDRNDFRQESATIKNNLGSFYMGYGDLIKAEKYLSEALGEFTTLQDTIWITRVTINLAGVDFMQGRNEESLRKLRNSAALARISYNLRSEGGTYSNIAIVYESLGQIDSALFYIDKGIDILRKLDDKRSVILSQKQQANILIKSKRVNEARKTFEDMILNAKEMNYPFGIHDAYLGWSELEKKENNLNEAYDLALLAIQWKDSVITEKNIETINELTTRYETAKKDAEISLLTLDKEKSASQRKIFIILMISTITILGLMTFLYLQIRKSKKTLTEKNHIISDALKEKEVLIKEIHHRVKNNLQIVSSLLNIQKKFLGNNTAIEAVADIQTRVQSMSLVHQNLYNGSNITDVNSQDYLSDLLTVVQKSYDTSSHEIEVKMNIESIALSSTQAVNIGLLVTELVSNAYKHAFPTSYNGGAEIGVYFKKTDDFLALTIHDNGVGSKNESSHSSYGMRLIQSLTKSMKGEMKFENQNGSSSYITFPYET